MGSLLRITETISSSGIDVIRTVDLDAVRERYPAVPDDPYLAGINLHAALTGALGDDMMLSLEEDLQLGSDLVLDYEERTSDDADPHLLGNDGYMPIWFVEEVR